MRRHHLHPRLHQLHKKKLFLTGMLTAALVLGLTGCGRKNGDVLTITNVSYDPTREFYEAYNPQFEQYYKETYGRDVEVIQWVICIFNRLSTAFNPLGSASIPAILSRICGLS